MQRETAYSREAAEILAIDALNWLASEEDLLDVFMGSTGASREDLRRRLDDGDFLGSILDFLMMDDQWVVGFCDARSLPYTAPGRARMSLPGGQAVNWT